MVVRKVFSCKSSLYWTTLTIGILLFSMWQMPVVAADSPLAFAHGISLGKTNPLHFNPYVKVYRTGFALSADSAFALITNGQMRQGFPKASQGFSLDYYWLHFTLDGSVSTEQKLALVVDNPHIDRLVLFRKDSTQFNQIGIGGDRMPFDERSYRNRRFVFPFLAPTHQTEFLLLIDKRNSSISIPLSLCTLTQFEKSETGNNVFYGFLFGMLAIVGIFSLALGPIMKQSLFTAYGIYVLLLALYVFTALGFSFQFLYPWSANFNNYLRIVLVVFLSMASLHFSAHFLRVNLYKDRLTKGFQWVMLAFAGLFIAWLLFFNLFEQHVIWVLNIVYFLLLLTFVLIAIALKRAFKTDTQQAILFIAAFSGLILASIIEIAFEYGILDEKPLTVKPIIIAIGVEIMVLSVGMILRLKNNLIEKAKLEFALTEISEQHNLTVEENEALKLQQKTAVSEPVIHDANRLNDRIVLNNKTILPYHQIEYITVTARYLEFHMVGKSLPVLDRCALKDFLAVMPKDLFVQIHRSHVVNLSFISKIRSTEIQLSNGTVLPLSRTFKDGLKLKSSLKIEDV